jgi:hypothetical protein
MSRIGGEQQIKVPPKNNVYTVLAAVGAVAGIVALVLMIIRAQEIMPPGIMK